MIALTALDTPTYGLRQSKDWVETTQASSATRFDELVASSVAP
jgi:hypothetical protein